MVSTRRDFMKATALTGVGFWAMAGNESKARQSANDKIGIAGFGVSAQGGGILNGAGGRRETEVVVICDPDRKLLANAQQKYPQAKAFTDYRKAFDEMEKSIDAATVGTPDHVHACISLRAMRAKIHCYTEKPLTRTIYEARLLGQVAKETGVCTQMGNMGSDNNNLRKGAAQLKAGVLGNILSVHCWTGRPSWPQGPGRRETLEKFSETTKARQPADRAEELIAAKKAELDKALEDLDWESWIGPAPDRPFWPQLYHQFRWRGWFDFGSGALGDMACHTVNMPYAGCDLKYPTSVIAKTSGHDFDSLPGSSEIKFEFPAVGGKPAFEFYWYDGGKRAPAELRDLYKVGNPGSGALVIGEKGALLSPGDYNGEWNLYGKDGAPAPEKISEDKLEYPQARDGHMGEWFRAIRMNKPEECWSNFTTNAGPFCETLLLGNLAVWAAPKKDEWGEKIEWNAEKLEVTNLASLQTPGIAELLKPKYREGHVLDV